MIHQHVDHETLVAVATKHYGHLNNQIAFYSVKFPDMDAISCVVARHAPMSPRIDDFLTIEPWPGFDEYNRSVKEPSTTHIIHMIWKTPRYYLIPETAVRDFDEYIAEVDTVRCTEHVSRFAALPETNGDKPSVRYFRDSTQYSDQLFGSSYQDLAMPNREEFLDFLTRSLTATLLTDLDRLVAVKRSGHGAPGPEMQG